MDGAAPGDISNEKPSSEMMFPTPKVTGCLSTYKLQIYLREFVHDYNKRL